MIVAIFNVYLVILFILVKTKIVSFNLFWKCSPLIVLLLLMFGLFIPMGWGAPQGAALVVRNSVQIVPNVAGEVTEVPVEPNKPLKAGDVLFKIDPVPYQAQVDSIGAQVKFEELRLSQMTQLQLSDAGRAFDVEQRQADVDKLKGQLLGAKWNLDQTVVRAPADGYVTNVGLMKGARVARLPLSPVMAFIDTSETVVGSRSRRSIPATSSLARRSRSRSSFSRARSSTVRSIPSCRRRRRARSWLRVQPWRRGR